MLGSDLSGGLDSTTLAFYADRYARQLVTVRQDAYDATNDDVKWAALARSRMGTGDHIRMEPDALVRGMEFDLGRRPEFAVSRPQNARIHPGTGRTAP